MNAPLAGSAIPVVHVIKGEVIHGADHEYGPPHARFTTPALDLNSLVWPRHEPGPAFDTASAEIVDIMVELGRWIDADSDGLMAEALEHSVAACPLPRGVIERSYRNLSPIFDRQSMEFQIANELGGADVLDGWREVPNAPSGRSIHIRAFPPRMIHILAGNSPGVSALTIVRGALTKGVHLMKIPSNDLFTATALLRGLAAVAPGHALTRSFIAVYWRGGDEGVESRLFRPQFFDKLSAWGGEAALRSAKAYIGPGFELIAFDPKTSISMIGREAFASDECLAVVADLAATDVTLFNQQACAASRVQFIEGSAEQVDRYCELLQERLGVERLFASACGAPPPQGMRDEIDALRDLEPEYRVWGKFDGRGVVIRSDEPVDFHPDERVVNVVRVADLRDAVRHTSVATQTIGVYPPERKAQLRDAVASMGMQRIVALGDAIGVEAGLPHDGFYPLRRFVRWLNDEG